MVLMMAVSAMAIFGFGLFQRETADFRGETEMIELVEADGSFRLVSYDHFFDLCAAVQTKEAEIVNAEDSDVPNRDTVLLALRNQRAGLINDYNADARKARTRGQFRDLSLPDRLSVDAVMTNCEVSQ